MNARDKMIMTKKLTDLISHTSKVGNYRGYLKVKPNRYEHELAKFNICYWLVKNGFIVYTEATVKGGGIPDIIAIKDGQGMIIEVLDSEKKKIANLASNPKIDYYPEDFQFLEVDCKNYLGEVTAL